MIRITAAITHTDEKTAEALLTESGFDIRRAVTEYNS